MESDLKFKDCHLPCPACGSSDALSVNENGSAKCFSCDEFFPKGVEDTGTKKNNSMTKRLLKSMELKQFMIVQGR